MLGSSRFERPRVQQHERVAPVAFLGDRGERLDVLHFEPRSHCTLAVRMCRLGPSEEDDAFHERHDGVGGDR